MIPVSTSEVAAFGTCQYRWMYAHHWSYHLESAKLGPALTRGLLGHSALEFFYTTYQKTEDYDHSVNETIMRTMLGAAKLFEAEPDKAAMLSALANRLKLYFEYYRSDMDLFEILEVEKYIEAPLPGIESAYFAGRVDLVIKWKYGQFKGETSPLDHKFVYNFWPKGALELNAQMPNYVWALREMDTPHVRRAIVNQIRHREMREESMVPEKLWQRPEIVPSLTEVNSIVDNHVKIARQIVRLQGMSKEEVRKEATRSILKFNCEYCPFYRLCKAELTGEPTDDMIAVEFKPNSYGYADRDDENG